MPIPSPQQIATFVDVDNTVYVTMKKNGSLAGLTMVAEVTSNTDDSIVATKPVTVVNPGSDTTKAVLSFQLSPDADNIPVSADGYKYWVYVTTAGSRDVISWGSLVVRKRTS